ncbi:YrhK family protein [Rhodalgimonas zhirmunskyi]|uniref:YrhK family protein n=1 Tax=Rhodalgimonas zhirmunskyi TaxID=2964767 RepID=A0AAJ1UEE4_9RHOB|nr:YrhK family protein [Rhodoalgimonas zhirmunskyi]MDQ2094497.1 YrhK family protein [Rhodoalgimonas zhirmunskyi]
MKLFNTLRSEHTPEQRRFYALTEIAYTAVDFSAAALFIVGSVFFFYESLMTAGTWLFLIGSCFFAMKPSIRLWREIKLLRMGDYADLAQKRN